jgi:OOP family OmpA-OmpF porin
MKKLLKGTLTGLLLVTLATPGFAENRQGSVNVSPFVGGYLLDKDQREENRPIFGLRAGYNFTGNLGIEGMFGYSLTETKRGINGSRETDLYRYGGEFLYHFMPDSSFVPFIAVGGGGTNFHTPQSSSQKNHSAGLVDYGGGVKYFVAPDVAMRGDLRHAILLNDAKDNNLEYSVGLTFQFGGVRKTAALIAAAEDGTAPTVIFTAPVNGATMVYVNQKANVAFSEDMDPATISGAPKVIGVLATLENSHFDFDSAAISENGKTILNHNAKALKANPDMKLHIAGYASAAGSEAYNQGLSERRAATVKEYLVKIGGIDGSRLSTIGYGEANPAKHEADPSKKLSAEALANMRVVLEIVEE